MKAKNPHAVALGREGGLKTSERKRKAVIRNLEKFRNTQKKKRNAP